MKLIMSLPKGSFTAKSDIAEAFRLLPVHPEDYPKLGFMFQGKYYFDRCLPMGCSSSCSIFESFSSALEVIFKHLVPGAKVVHMLDDFLFIAPDYDTCLHHLNKFMDLCQSLGVPIAADKTTTPSTNTVFLGIELDSNLWQAKLPHDKLQSYSKEVELSLQVTKIKRMDLESLVGKLSFAASVVPARPFLRRLINLIYTVDKPYFFIRLSTQVRQDLVTWLKFLRYYNGVTFFRSLDILESPAINFTSDASHKGFGACYGSRWIQAPYPESWQKFHITVLELYPIYVLINMFGHLIRNSNILFHCDNSAVTSIINSQTSKDPIVMSIIRPLILSLIEYNISLKAKHISGSSNVLSDRISRFQVTPQLLLRFHMQSKPTLIPQHLLPTNFVLS